MTKDNDYSVEKELQKIKEGIGKLDDKKIEKITKNVEKKLKKEFKEKKKKGGFLKKLKKHEKKNEKEEKNKNMISKEEFERIEKIEKEKIKKRKAKKTAPEIKKDEKKKENKEDEYKIPSKLFISIDKYEKVTEKSGELKNKMQNLTKLNSFNGGLDELKEEAFLRIKKEVSSITENLIKIENTLENNETDEEVYDEEKKKSKEEIQIIELGEELRKLKKELDVM